MPKLLDAAEVTEALAGLKDWTLDGREISRTYKLPNFSSALAFVNAVGAAAETANHHPDIDIRWNKVSLTLSTHSAGGLTELDFQLARRADALAEIAALSYDEKFAEFIEIIRVSKESAVGQILVAQPWVLGDTYPEIIESLSRIADAKLALTVVQR